MWHIWIRTRTDQHRAENSQCTQEEFSSAARRGIQCESKKSPPPCGFLALFPNGWEFLINFYRAMHFSAKRGIAIACRLSVCLSVCLSVTLVNCDHIGWNSSKIVSPLVSLGCSLFAFPTWRVCSEGNTPKFGPKVTHPLLIWASETFDRKLRRNGYK